MIDWHGLHLEMLRLAWLHAACLYHLKRSQGGGVAGGMGAGMPEGVEGRNRLAFYSLTRIDVSDNQLTRLPGYLFQLPSLKILNASNNKVSL